MNEIIKKLAIESEAARRYFNPNGEYYVVPEEVEKFAELLIKECAKLNVQQAYELDGVITDVNEGSGFDSVCQTTVERVRQHLINGLQNHFGVK